MMLHSSPSAYRHPPAFSSGACGTAVVAPLRQGSRRSSSGAIGSSRGSFRLHALPGGGLSAADVHAHLSVLGDLADAAAATASTGSQSGGGFLAPLTDTLETVLKTIQTQLDKLHVPYSYGYSIIILTAIVKLVTLPLTKKQVESSMAVQSLKPRVEMIKARYGDDQGKIKRETNFLYEQAGVNPLAGCLPSLATIPIFIGLYRSLTNVASEGLLDTQGFYWIPTLAGPTTLAARQAGSGTEWLFPLVDGAPPIGWQAASAYLVLPVLLVVCQYISSAIISPPIDPTAENANTQRVLYAFLPLMVGWFSLNVPSGLGLYYLSNTAMTTLVQLWLRKLGGADVQINELGPITKVGTGRRMGPIASDEDIWTPSAAYAAAIAADAAAAEAAAAAAAGGAQAAAMAELQGQQAAAATVGDGGSGSSSSSSNSSSLPGAKWARRKRTVAAAPAPAPSST